MDECTPVDSSNTLAAAMVYLAALGFPENHTKRNRSLLAMTAWIARLRRRQGAADSPTSAVINAITERDMWGALNKLNRRIGTRLDVAKAAIKLQFFKNAYDEMPIQTDVQNKTRRELIFKHSLANARASELTAKTESITKDFTLNEIARNSGMSPGKFKDGPWRETLPVLHLAIALHSQILEMGLTQYDVLVLLTNHGGWVTKALEGGELHADSLHRLKGVQPALQRLSIVKRVRLIPQ